LARQTWDRLDEQLRTMAEAFRQRYRPGAHVDNRKPDSARSNGAGDVNRYLAEPGRRWNDLWRRVADSDPDPEYSRLAAAYSESHRAYHNLNHVAECLSWLDRCRDLALEPDSIELAIWFHDLVHRPFFSQNERRSAEWARRSLTRGGASEQLSDRVVSIILATAHSHVPQARDEQLMVDIDLAILGADPRRYTQYERAIRHEYRLVPATLYRTRRARLLSSFLNRTTVYRTPWFQERLEDQARRNLARAIEILRGGVRSRSLS